MPRECGGSICGVSGSNRWKIVEHKIRRESEVIIEIKK
jgi:hypothetical protein